MNRIFFMVYSFDCSEKAPGVLPHLVAHPKVRGRWGVIRAWCRCSLSYLPLNNVFPFGALSPHSRQSNTRKHAAVQRAIELRNTPLTGA